jgi:hypothetical protein
MVNIHQGIPGVGCETSSLSCEHCTWRHFPGGRGYIPNFLGKVVLGMVDEEQWEEVEKERMDPGQGDISTFTPLAGEV